MNMIELKIFFSWQTSSNTDRLNNKKFIWDAINAAANGIKDKGDLKGISFDIKQGTGGAPGTPDMVAECLLRNDKCHIFIADISVDKKFNKLQRWANKKPELRERPNENVMYELGRADGHLYYDQVIHVANTVFGDVSQNDYLRPVDIRHKRRPITFCLADNKAPDADNISEELVNDLKKALRSSVKAALAHINEELRPYENCEDILKELKFKKKFFFKGNLNDIKKAILNNKRILRVLGQSGVGKTRLVLETILGEQNDNPKLYCDCQMFDENEVLAKSTLIFEQYKNAILVLDNCDIDLFRKIKEMYNRKSSENRLYAITDAISEYSAGKSSDYVQFEDSYEEVVDEIIRSLYVKQDDISAEIKKSACGNPLFAVQAIEGVIKTGDTRDFNNQKLISNMLSAPEGSKERIIAQTLSLFSSIGYEGAAHNEIDEIAINKNITRLSDDATILVNKFNLQIKKYVDRRLMQRVGAYVCFRSSAIQKQLASEWFEKCTASQFEKIIISLGKMGMAGSLVPQFFDQVKNLENNDIVLDLFKELLQPGRLMTSMRFLNSEAGSKTVRSLVEIMPDLVAESLFKALGGLDIEQLKHIRDGRRELVWTLEKLCYKPETFEKSAKLLLRLACAENEFISNNATGLFISLFPVLLPSTSVSLDQRLAFLRKEIESEEEKPIILKAINRALCTGNFIHFGGEVKIGSQKFSFYQPEKDKEVEDYVNGCLDLLQKEIDGNTAYTEDSFKLMASNFRLLNSFGLFDIIMPRIEKLAAVLNFECDDMLHALNYARKDKEILSNKQKLQRVETMIAKMTKTDFVSRFSRVESYECNDYLHLSDTEHNRIVTEKYETLASEIAEKHLYNQELLNGIYGCQTFMSQPFAIKLASLSTPEKQLNFAAVSIDILEERPNTIFVYFIKEVSEEVFEKIVSLIYEKSKKYLMFSLVAVRNYPFEHHYVDKLFELVNNKEVDVSLFVTYWNYVRMDRLSSPEAVNFLSRVMAFPDSFATSLNMAMSQYLSNAHNNPAMDSLFESEIIKRADKVSEMLHNSQFSHIVGVLLSNSKRDYLARVVGKGAFQIIVKSEHASLNYEVESVLQILFEKYFDIAWKEMSFLMSRMVDEGNFFKLFYALGFSALHNPFPSLIFRKGNEQVLKDWCNNHPDVGPYRLMAFAPLSDANGLSIPVMYLLDNYGSQKLVRTALSDKLGTFSGPTTTYDDRAKLIEPLKNHKNPDVCTWAGLEIDKLKISKEQFQKAEDSILLPGRLPEHQWTLIDDDEYATGADLGSKGKVRE